MQVTPRAATACLLSIAALAVPAAACAKLPPLPRHWPKRLQLGLTDGPGGAAELRRSVPFGFRYQYLAGGVNTDHFVIHLRRPRHQRIVRVKVYIDGERVLGRRGRNLKKVVLHEVPEGRKFRLRIVEYTNTGIRISRSRTYRGCADKR